MIFTACRLYTDLPFWFDDLRQECMNTKNGPFKSFALLRNIQHFEVLVECGSCGEIKLVGLGTPSGAEFSETHDYFRWDEELMRIVQLLSTSLENLTRNCYTKDDTYAPVTGSQLQDALRASGIDVYREDRIRRNSQGGFISCRTRGRLHRLKEVSMNGVIPEAPMNLKYLEVDEYNDNGRI